MSLYSFLDRYYRIGNDVDVFNQETRKQYKLKWVHDGTGWVIPDEISQCTVRSVMDGKLMYDRHPTGYVIYIY